MIQRARKGVIMTALLISSFLFALPSAPAQETGGIGGQSNSHEGNVVQFYVDASFVASFEAVVPAERPHATHSEDPTELPCVEYIAGSDGSGNAYILCVAYYHCGGERIDELYTGDISGNQAGGAYAEYLAEATNTALADGPNLPADATIQPDPNEISDGILDGALPAASDPLLLPVFYYCRIGAGGPLEYREPDYTPTFGWDTDIESEYDIITVSNLLADQLLDELETTIPEIRMTPPVENGFTIVKFPSWFWIHEPDVEILVYAISDQDTIMLNGRATLDRVEWTLGATTLSCTPDQMTPYTDNLHPFDDRPHCWHRFLTLEPWQLAATAHYRIDQQITRRLGRNGNWVSRPWEPHPTTPTLAVTNDLGTMEVRRIPTVAVAADFDADSYEAANYEPVNSEPVND